MQQPPRWYSLSPKLSRWLIAFAALSLTMALFGYLASRGSEAAKALAGLAMLAFMFLLIPFWRRWRAARFWSLFDAKILFHYPNGATALRVVLRPRRDLTLPGLYVVCWPSFYTKVKRVSRPSWLLRAAKSEAAQLRLIEALPLRANQTTTLDLEFDVPAGSGGRDELALYVLPAAQPPMGFSFHLRKSGGLASPETRLLPPTTAPEAPPEEASYRGASEDLRHIIAPPALSQIRASITALERWSLCYVLGVISFVLGLFMFFSFLGAPALELTLLRVVGWLSLSSLALLFAARFRRLPVFASLGLAGFYYQNSVRWSGLSTADDPAMLSGLLASWALWFLLLGGVFAVSWALDAQRHLWRRRSSR
jgi:hypothetical protein